uniref:SAM domain, SH3 domain and nuclear localisation signals 1b n=1 Tax=Acanthochromis polyacanthus TaxID=80966 RepID=A0A3Q1EPY8_9TELE
RTHPAICHQKTHILISPKQLARCGRLDALRQHSSLLKPQDNGSCPVREPTTSAASLSIQEFHFLTCASCFYWPAVADLSIYCVFCCHSKSRSGVTSGSDCSSNRDSLRLDDDLLYTRQFCSRARVHTDYVPSPYDTESLKLKVGDVIDIIAKPPMGIWTGMLNGRMGNFKFIYVDVLTEESSKTHQETQIHEASHKSTVHEVLKRLSLEEYSSSLQLNGYQTVDDLMRLREHHLMELNVTDPEHRQRLLAAVDSLQQLGSVSQLENEAKTSSESRKADMSNCPRDSGCDMPPDSPEQSNHSNAGFIPAAAVDVTYESKLVFLFICCDSLTSDGVQ